MRPATDYSDDEEDQIEDLREQIIKYEELNEAYKRQIQKLIEEDEST